MTRLSNVCSALILCCVLVASATAQLDPAQKQAECERQLHDFALANDLEDFEYFSDPQGTCTELGKQSSKAKCIFASLKITLKVTTSIPGLAEALIALFNALCEIFSGSVAGR